MDHSFNRRICYEDADIFFLKILPLTRESSSSVENNQIVDILQSHLFIKVNKTLRLLCCKCCKTFIIRTSVSYLLKYSSRFKALQPLRLTKAFTYFEPLLIDFSLAHCPSSLEHCNKNSGLTDFSTVCQLVSKRYSFNFKVI